MTLETIYLQLSDICRVFISFGSTGTNKHWTPDSPAEWQQLQAGVVFVREKQKYETPFLRLTQEKTIDLELDR